MLPAAHSLFDNKNLVKQNQNENGVLDYNSCNGDDKLLELGVNVSSIISSTLSSLSPESPLEKLLTILLEKINL